MKVWTNLHVKAIKLLAHGCHFALVLRVGLIDHVAHSGTLHLEVLSLWCIVSVPDIDIKFFDLESYTNKRMMRKLRITLLL